MSFFQHQDFFPKNTTIKFHRVDLTVWWQMHLVFTDKLSSCVFDKFSVSFWLFSVFTTSRVGTPVGPCYSRILATTLSNRWYSLHE